MSTPRMTTSRMTNLRMRTTSIVAGEPVALASHTHVHLVNDDRRGAAITIDGRSAAVFVFTACLVFELALVLLDYFVNYGRLTESVAIRRLTNIAREDGLASWFSSTQTLLVGLTAWVFWLGARADHRPLWRRAGWCLVAGLFTYMAVDDAAQLHERIGAAFKGLRGPSSLSFPSFTWHLLFVPLFAVTGAISVGFLWRELGAGLATWLLATGFLLFGFAVGLDFVEGLETDHPWNVYAAILTQYDAARLAGARLDQAHYNVLLHFSRSLEEFLEMLGTTCIWTSMLTHADALPDICFESRV